jgi:hypothetical protein
LTNEADAASIISSNISKEEQALAESAVGERLPYNDYTTIDWLHDLVRTVDSVEMLRLKTNRSKTPSDIVLSIVETAFDMRLQLHSTRAKAGSQPP